MAHFAKIENGFVTSVIVVANSDCGDCDFPASNSIGKTFIASLGIEGVWEQTSYNSNFRNCYASTHSTFDPLLGEYGEFIAPIQIEPTPPLN